MYSRKGSTNSVIAILDTSCKKKTYLISVISNMFTVKRTVAKENRFTTNTLGIYIIQISYIKLEYLPINILYIIILGCFLFSFFAAVVVCLFVFFFLMNRYIYMSSSICVCLFACFLNIFLIFNFLWKLKVSRSPSAILLS